MSQRTPTVDADRLYAVTAGGELICLAVDDVTEAMTAAAAIGIEFAQAAPHQAPRGRRAA